jgi:hypothetical protein
MPDWFCGVEIYRKEQLTILGPIPEKGVSLLYDAEDGLHV